MYILGRTSYRLGETIEKKGEIKIIKKLLIPLASNLNYGKDQLNIQLKELVHTKL
jgi:hypothetical protein